MSLSQAGKSKAKIVIALLSVVVLAASCNNKQEKPPAAAQDKFASPDAAATALVTAARSSNGDAVLAVLGPGSKDVVSSGDAATNQADLAGFVSDYETMHRWRKLPSESLLLITGADNKVFPLPLKKGGDAQWSFDVQAGKEEIAARRIGRNELAAMDICWEIANAQQAYFSQHHGGAKQYAQKFISDEGQQNGLYWPEVSGQPKSPLGPLIAFATAQGLSVQPNQHQPFYGYYFALLQKQGPDAKGGAKNYVANGKMTGGFAVLAWPAAYGDSGIMTFLVNQNGQTLQKDLGGSTAQIAPAMADFNPDKTWTVVE